MIYFEFWFHLSFRFWKSPLKTLSKWIGWYLLVPVLFLIFLNWLLSLLEPYGWLSVSLPVELAACHLAIIIIIFDLGSGMHQDYEFDPYHIQNQITYSPWKSDLFAHQISLGSICFENIRIIFWIQDPRCDPDHLQILITSSMKHYPSAFQISS